MRKYQAGTSSYRYGFQNQEIDPELWGGGISFKYRVEDPRLNRFFSIDPLSSDYPHNSPYAFAENRLIDGIELEGAEWKPVTGADGTPTDYKYVGFDSKGNGVAGSVPYGTVRQGDNLLFFNSNSSAPNPETGNKISTASIHVVNTKTFENWNISLSNGTNVVHANYNGSPDFYQKGYNNLINENGGRLVGLSGLQLRDIARTARDYASLWPDGEQGLEYPLIDPVDILAGGLYCLGKSLTGASSKIIGTAQITGTGGHAFTSNLLAWRYALDPRVERVTLDIGYKRLLGGGLFKYGPRPDVGVLFKSGKTLAIEVMSRTDIESRLLLRNNLFIQRWGIQGTTKAYKPYFGLFGK